MNDRGLEIEAERARVAMQADKQEWSATVLTTCLIAAVVLLLVFA